MPKLYAITVLPEQIEHTVNQINSKKFQLREVERLPFNQWLFAYEGSELLHLVRKDDEVGEELVK